MACNNNDALRLPLLPFSSNDFSPPPHRLLLKRQSFLSSFLPFFLSFFCYLVFFPLFALSPSFLELIVGVGSPPPGVAVPLFVDL